MDHGIKIAKAGFDATDIPTEETKKNFIILSGVDAHKLVLAAFVTGGTFTHNLGKVPFHYAFEVDSVVTPTYFKPVRARANTTQIFGLPSKAYVMVLNEGG